MVENKNLRNDENIKRVEKLTGVKKELISIKNKLETQEIEIITLKKDNIILRKLCEDLKETFVKRRRWEHISKEIQKKKMEEIKNEG